MIYLLIVTLIWAFSFGLIKNQLAALDSNFVAFTRLAISLLIFLPFLRFKMLDLTLGFKLILTGAVQYGLMYLSYIYAYQFLPAYQVALFTIFTPLYIALLNDLFTRKFHLLYLSVALLSVIGTGIIVYRDINRSALQFGFILMQISNISFALGQVYYKKLLSRSTQIKDAQIFALLYLGAVVLSGLFSVFITDWSVLAVNQTQWVSLIYLGIVSSGLGFYLWNVGVRRTNTGTLAVFNNLKIPFAMIVALLIFSEQANLPRLLIGSFIIFSALFFSEYFVYKSKKN